MKADYTKILNEAFRITFKNKWLWVFALVIVTLGGNSFRFNGPSGGDSSDYSDTSSTQQNNKQLYDPENLFNTSQQVLGDATSIFWDLFTSISPIYFIALILFGLLAAAIGITISLYARAWATSSLIYGIDQENQNVSLGLKELSHGGRPRTVELIKLTVFPGLIAFLIFLFTALLNGLLFLGPSGLRIIATLLLALLILVFMIVVILLSASIHLGKISLVLKGLSWREALKDGFRVIKRFFMDVVLMGCINCFFGAIASIASCVVLLIAFALGAGAALGIVAFPPAAIVLFPLLVLGGLLVFSFVTLVSAVYHVFNQSTWVLLYKQLMETEGVKTL